MSIPETCKINGCEREGVYIKKNNKKYLIKGMCSAHYKRSKKGAEMQTPIKTFKRKVEWTENYIKVPLQESENPDYSIVDLDDASKVKGFFWHKTHYGYAATNILDKGRKTQIKLHHVIIGKPPKEMDVDHINRNKLDNRKSNLRFVSRSLNVRNRPGHADSGHKGVYKSKNKYEARYTIGGSVVRLGRFDTKKAAIEVYKKSIIEKFGEELY